MGKTVQNYPTLQVKKVNKNSFQTSDSSKLWLLRRGMQPRRGPPLPVPPAWREAPQESTWTPQTPSNAAPATLSCECLLVYLLRLWRASLETQTVKSPPAMQETPAWSWVGKVPWRMEGQPTPLSWPGEFHGKPGRLQSMRSQRVRPDWVINTFILHYEVLLKKEHLSVSIFLKHTTGRI